MDTLNDHVARISARIEEYRTLDLIGRNSADDLQHHLRALAAELDEANARAGLQLERAERLAEAILGLCEGDANDIEFELDLYPLDLYDQTDGNLDAALGDTNN